MLARLRKSTEEREGGFTLIELLVVVIIIGILSAIAIPTFLKQREKAWDKALNSDLRNNALKMEEYLDDNGSYPAAGAGPAAPYNFKTSETNSATTVAASGASGFCLRAASTKSFTDNIKFFDSKVGRPNTTDCTAVSYA